MEVLKNISGKPVIACPTCGFSVLNLTAYVSEDTSKPNSKAIMECPQCGYKGTHEITDATVRQTPIPQWIPAP